MTTTWPDESPARPFAPPVQAGVPAPSPPIWPTVLGIIAIIIGGFGLLSNGCGGLMAPVIQTQMSKLIPPGSDPVLDAQMRITQKYLWFSITNAIMLFSLGIMLLVAGIGLIRRRSWSRRLLMLWAILRIIVTVPASYFGYVITVETMQVAMNAANSGAAGAPKSPPGLMNFFQVFGVVGVIIGAAMVCACPLFTLIWFSRFRIRTQVDSWRATAGV